MLTSLLPAAHPQPNLGTQTAALSPRSGHSPLAGPGVRPGDSGRRRRAGWAGCTTPSPSARPVLRPSSTTLPSLRSLSVYTAEAEDSTWPGYAGAAVTDAGLHLGPHLDGRCFPSADSCVLSSTSTLFLFLFSVVFSGIWGCFLHIFNNSVIAPGVSMSM